MKKNKNWLLWRNLIYSLVLFGSIKTTQARAKAIQGLIDKLVNKIKKGTVAKKREVLRVLPQKEAVDKLAGEIVPKLGSRSSGYTQIIKIGERQGDGAAMVIIRWVVDKETKTIKVEKGTEETEVLKEEKPAERLKTRKKSNAKTNKTK